MMANNAISVTIRPVTMPNGPARSGFNQNRCMICSHTHTT